MRPAVNRVLQVAAAAWIVAGMLCYSYAFSRDFYRANAHAVHLLLHSAGLENE